MAGTHCRSCWRLATHQEWRSGRGWKAQWEGPPRLAPWRGPHPSGLGIDPVESLHSRHGREVGQLVAISPVGRSQRGDPRADAA